ncbi:MAG: phage tail length tape measure family protein [Acetobacteraceae bacterium]
MSEQIITELIVDARGAEPGTAQFVAMMGVAQRAVDKHIQSQEKLAEQATAAGNAAAGAGQQIETGARSVSAAERAYAAYVARMDPAFAAQQKLTAETNRVNAAIDGLINKINRTPVDTEAYTKLAAQMSALTGRSAELRGTLDRLASGSMSVEQALGSLATESERAAAAARDAATSQAQMVARAQQIRDALDPLGVVQREYSAALADATRLQIAGLITDREYIETTNRSLAALDRKTAELDGSAQAARDAAAAEMQMTAQARQWIATADPAAASQARLNEARITGEKLIAAGLITQPQLTAGLKKLSDQHEQLYGTTTRSTGALRALSVQMPDVVQGVLSGQSAFQLLVQQGGQVISVLQLQGGVLSGLKAAFSALVSPIGLAVAAGVALVSGIVAVGAASEASARRMVDLQNALRATRTDYVNLAQEVNAAAKAVAATSQIGSGDARAAGLAIAGSVGFQGNQSELERLIKLSGDLAAAWGTTLPEAGRKLAAGLTDPAKAAHELADKTFPGVTQQLARTIDLMQKGGDVAGAQRLLIDAYSRAVAGAGEPHTRLQRAVSGLSEAFTSAGQSGRSLADVIGTTFTDIASFAVEQITRLVTAISWAKDKIAALLPGQLGGGTPAPGSFTGGLQPAIPTNNTIRPDLAQLLYRIAEQRNFGGAPDVSATQADLATQIMAIESSGGRNIRVSSAGAIGAMQLMPGTAAAMGVSPYDMAGNIEGGLRFIAQLWQQFGGDPVLVAMAYNWGPANVEAFLRGVKAIPVDVQKYAQTVTGISGDQLLQRYSGSFAAASRAGIGTNVVGRSDADLLQARINAADKQAQGLIPGQQEDIRAQIRNFDDLRAKVGENSAQGQAYSAVIKDLQGKLAELLTPMQQLDKSLRDQAALSGVAEGAAREYAQALQQATDVAVKQGDGTLQTADRLRVLQSVHDRLTGQYQQSIVEIDRQTAANNQFNAALANTIATYGSYTAAAQHLANVEKAREELRKTTTDNEPEYRQRLDETTAALDRQTRSLNERNLQPALDQQRQSIALIQAQTDALGMSAAEQDKYIAVFKAKQELESRNTDTQKGLGAEYIANVGRLSDLTAAYSQQKQALADIASAFTSAFDQLGQAITNSFLSGTGAAVNWKNVMLSVAQQVLQKFLQLAVLNPLLNSLFNQSNSTLGTVIAALGSAGGSGNASGSGGALNTLGNLGTVGSAANTLSGGSIYETLGITKLGGWLKDTLGLSGQGSLLSQIGNLGIFGTSTAEASLAAISPESIAAALGYNAAPLATQAGVGATQATGLFGGASLGNLAGGVGLGFGAGSLAGGFVQGAVGKTGYGPQIGAGTGAIAGAIIGSYVPVIGTVLGGLIGGLLGGGGGGLIGPPKPNPFTLTDIGVTPQGLLTQGGTASQLVDSNAAQTAAEIAQFNAALQSLGVTIASLTTRFGTATPGTGGGGTVGAEPNNPDHENTNWIGSDVASLFSAFRFTASDPTLADFLSGKPFADAGALAAAVQQFQAAQAAITTFLDSTAPQLTASATATGSLDQAIAQLNQQFAAAIATAQQYTASGAASADQLARLAQAETDLATARDAAIQKAQQQAAQQTQDLAAGLYSRFLAASAQASGVPADQLTAALYAFDVQADQQRRQFDAQMVALYGDAVRGTATYVNNATLLEATLGQERLAIQKAANDNLVQSAQQAQQQATQAQQQAAQNVAGTIASITDYVRTLQFGSNSALSPTSQYELASRQFNAVSGAALKGDYGSIQAITGYADQLLTASRTVNGSGAAFAADFQRVIDALGRIGEMPADTLTASAYAAEMRTQTQVLSTDLRVLQDLMRSLIAEFKHSGWRPARLVA